MKNHHYLTIASILLFLLSDTVTPFGTNNNKPFLRHSITTPIPTNAYRLQKISPFQERSSIITNSNIDDNNGEKNESDNGQEEILCRAGASYDFKDCKVGSIPDSDLDSNVKIFDIIVVGGGPAGIAGALKAAYMGKRVLIVDKPSWATPEKGGLDPYFGAPTGLFSKALRDCGTTINIDLLKAQNLDDDVIWHQIQNYCLRLATNNAEEVLGTLGRFKVGYLQGEATIVGSPESDDKNVEQSNNDKKKPFRIQIVRHDNGEISHAKGTQLLVCLGSKARGLPGLKEEELLMNDKNNRYTRRIFTADSINYGLTFLPKSAVIVGSGIIAAEYAKILRNVGADVTLIVRGKCRDAFLRMGLDTDLIESLIDDMVDDGIKFLEETTIDQFLSPLPEDVEDGQPLKFSLKQKETTTTPAIMECDIILAATGRIPSTISNSLGLVEANVQLDDKSKHIIVNPETMETSVPGLYAAGDCVRGAGLVSTGVDQAQCAVTHMFRDPKATSTTTAPRKVSYPIGIWTIPEIAYFGETKEMALARGIEEVEEGIATYDQCLRGRMLAPKGILKLVFDVDTSVILGVHIIGKDACEMVHYGMELVNTRATIFSVVSSLFTAVTFHELFKEAAINGNSKLEYGIQWQDIFQSLASISPVTNVEAAVVDEENVRRCFQDIDVNNDGSLDEQELLQVISKLSKRDISPSAVASLVYLSDEDGNGTIEYPEFLRIIQALKRYERNESAKQKELQSAQP